MKHLLALALVAIAQMGLSQSADIPASPTFSTTFVFTPDQLNKAHVQKQFENSPAWLTSSETWNFEEQKALAFNTECRQADSRLTNQYNEWIKTNRELKDLEAIGEKRKELNALINNKTDYEKQFETELNQNSIQEGLWFLVVKNPGGLLNDYELLENAKPALSTELVTYLSGVYITYDVQIENDIIKKRMEGVRVGTLEHRLEKGWPLTSKEQSLILVRVSSRPFANEASQSTTTSKENIVARFNYETMAQDAINWMKSNGVPIDEQNAFAREAGIMLDEIALQNKRNQEAVTAAYQKYQCEKEDPLKTINGLRSMVSEMNAQLESLVSLIFPKGCTAKTLADTLEFCKKEMTTRITAKEQTRQQIESLKFEIETLSPVMGNSGEAPVSYVAGNVVTYLNSWAQSLGKQNTLNDKITMEGNTITDRSKTNGTNTTRKLSKAWVYVRGNNNGGYDVSFLARFDLVNENTANTANTTSTTTTNSNLPAPIQKLINDMVYVEGGTFTMGGTWEQGSESESDEKPPHNVTLTPFSMQKLEVTIAQFEAFVKETKYITDAEKEGDSYIVNNSGNWEEKAGITWRHDATGNLYRETDKATYPVIHISWNDAKAFADWVSKLTGKKYSLPTEAQWEYAARDHGKEIKYAWGNGNPTKSMGGNVADVTAKSKFNWTIFEGYSDGYIYTAPVGQFGANSTGLFDMTGNVWEWCSDWYSSDYYAKSETNNPKGPATGSIRVLRGGGWNFDPTICRVAGRNGSSPASRNCSIGFRLVLQ